MIDSSIKRSKKVEEQEQLTDKIGIPVSAEMKKKVKSLAYSREMTISELVRKLLEKELKKND